MAGPAGRPKKRKFPLSAAAADDNEASSSPAAEESQESATAGQEEVDLNSAELKSDNDDGATHSSADAEETNPEKQPPPPNPYDAIRRAIVINDGSRQNLIRLIGLKSHFAKKTTQNTQGIHCPTQIRPTSQIASTLDQRPK